MTKPTTKTLKEILDEGIKMVPIFTDYTCSSFKVGVYYNGIPHAIWKDVYKTQEECQQVIDPIINRYNALRS